MPVFSSTLGRSLFLRQKKRDPLNQYSSSQTLLVPVGAQTGTSRGAQRVRRTCVATPIGRPSSERIVRMQDPALTFIAVMRGGRCGGVCRALVQALDGSVRACGIRSVSGCARDGAGTNRCQARRRSGEKARCSKWSRKAWWLSDDRGHSSIGALVFRLRFHQERSGEYGSSDGAGLPRGRSALLVARYKGTRVPR